MQTRGTIYHHSRLVFHNGFVGKKYLILLNTPSKDEPYLFLKTTSQRRNKPSLPGCMKEHSLFFIPADKTFFKLDTWVQLYEIYELQASDVINNRDLSVVGNLSSDLIKEIIDCLFLAEEDDMLQSHKRLIKPAMDESLQKLLEKFGKKPR